MNSFGLFTLKSFQTLSEMFCGGQVGRIDGGNGRVLRQLQLAMLISIIQSSQSTCYSSSPERIRLIFIVVHIMKDIGKM
jgi:hypothetical protein